MQNKRIAIGALVILLVAGAAGVPACAPAAYDQSVQEIAQAIPIAGWQQVNSNGFGDSKELEVSALDAFNGYLYAGTYNVVDPLTIFDGARIYRSPDGLTWTPVTQPGFQDPHDSAPPAILDFVVFGNRLYASTGRGGNAAQIWRASTGVSWAPMVAAGFGDPDIHEIAALAVYNNVIYAGASSQVSGARIFLSSTGDSNTWNPVAPAAPTMPGAGVTGFAVFNGALYAAVESEAPIQIWRTSSAGGAWTSVVNNGFGDSLTTSTGGMAVFGGYLCVGAGNSAVGAQLWCSSDGANWAQALNPGFGDPNNQKVEMVFVFQNQLYLGLKNTVTGMEVWRSSDGAFWEQVNQDGFGDSNNPGTNGSNATANFLNQLYVGTSNIVAGGELWQMLQQLPDTPTATSTDTPTNTATHTSTFTPTDTPTVTPTDTPTATQPPTETPTPTPADTATSTATGTQIPTDTPANTPTDVPTNSATDTPTATQTPAATPLMSTPGMVNGGGTLGTGNDNLHVTFGFTLNYSPGDLAPKGNLTYQDHTAKLRLKADSFDLLVIEGDHAWFTGMGIMDNGQVVSFTVEINVLNKQGFADTFSISIPAMNGYVASGALAGGNMTIH